MTTNPDSDHETAYLYPLGQFALPPEAASCPDLPKAWVRVRANGPEPDADAEVEHPPRWELEARRIPFAGLKDAAAFANDLVCRIMAGDSPRDWRDWQWTVELVVDHPLDRELEDPFLELGTTVWNEVDGNLKRVPAHHPLLDWFVLDLSTGRTWLTNYAPQDIERLDRDAVAAMDDPSKVQWKRCYIWVALETGQPKLKCITQILREPSNDIECDERDSPYLIGSG